MPVQSRGQGNTHAVSARKVLGVTQYNVPNVNNGYMLDAAVPGVNSPKSKISSAIHAQVHLETWEEEENIVIGNSSHEAVQQFCYLGDMLSAGGGAEASSVTRTRCAWKKFRELLPTLSSRTFSLKKKGSFYQSCVRPVLLYGNETWPVKKKIW